MTSTPQETEAQRVSYPTVQSSPEAKEAEFHEATSSATVTEESQPNNQPPASDEETKKLGTHIMGAPAAPNVHSENQQAALWNASEHQQIYEYPYLVYTPVEKSEKSAQKSLEPVIQKFQEWGKKTETIARNIWQNLKTGPSVPQAAWGKVNLTAKAITEGGFESLFKQIFETGPNEKLMKIFACYLSTSTGPVAGTLYLSTARVAFCSDRPLCYTAPSGEEAWSYYKVMIPLGKISTVNPVIMKESPPEKYIQIVTIDGHEFWFMGFVNFEKASHHLLEKASNLREAEYAVQPVVV
ncbi:GEM-like protein 5 [Populus nigra]|uniref:GEM-like protein 5 n=1 Tax=Populus nigra TaxID=3691 RepID=UPI002B26F120|nr:GEM-like protein 5 [Populus nigra]